MEQVPELLRWAGQPAYSHGQLQTPKWIWREIDSLTKIRSMTFLHTTDRPITWRYDNNRWPVL